MIPIRYNLRSLMVRRATSVMMASVVALVVMLPDPLQRLSTVVHILTRYTLATVDSLCYLVVTMKTLLLAFVASFAIGCAHVVSKPLQMNGQYDNAQSEGVRYYPPKPYLLVTEVPVEKATQPADSNTDDPPSDSKSKKTPSQQPADDSTQGNTSKQKTSGSSGASPSPTTDTSFSMFTKQYGVKLIYLPDYSHPMALSVSTGLIGSAEMKPTFQDGWMLTSLDATADSKVSETISAMASLASAIGGGGAGSAAAGASKGMKAMAREGGGPVLAPGLYAFILDDKGNYSRLQAVAYFCSNGTSPTPC